MRLQHEKSVKNRLHQKLKKQHQKQKAEYGIVAIAAGEGIQKLFRAWV